MFVNCNFLPVIKTLSELFHIQIWIINLLNTNWTFHFSDDILNNIINVTDMIKYYIFEQVSFKWSIISKESHITYSVFEL